MDRGTWRGYSSRGHKESDMTERLSKHNKINTDNKTDNKIR